MICELNVSVIKLLFKLIINGYIKNRIIHVISKDLPLSPGLLNLLSWLLPLCFFTLIYWFWNFLGSGILQVGIWHRKPQFLHCPESTQLSGIVAILLLVVYNVLEAHWEVVADVQTNFIPKLFLLLKYPSIKISYVNCTEIFQESV